MISFKQKRIIQEIQNSLARHLHKNIQDRTAMHNFHVPRRNSRLIQGPPDVNLIPPKLTLNGCPGPPAGPTLLPPHGQPAASGSWYSAVASSAPLCPECSSVRPGPDSAPRYTRVGRPDPSAASVYRQSAPRGCKDTEKVATRLATSPEFMRVT